jgi:hypothetical protein
MLKTYIAIFIIGFVYASPAMAERVDETDISKLDRIPQRLFDHAAADRQLVGSPSLAWRRQVLTVAFNGGSESLYKLIEQTAMEWTAHGNALRFSFRDDNGQFRQWSAADRYPVAAIRISFSGDEPGYWSVTGRMAESVPAGEATMNFEAFPRKLARYFNRANASEWANSYERSVILHEFGHALGILHEHFHPQCQADMDISKVLAYATSKWGWTEEQARFNFDANYYFEVTGSNQREAFPDSDHRANISAMIDRSSVMLYRGLSPPDYKYYTSGAQSPCIPRSEGNYATSLSEGDVGAFLKYYQTIRPPF